MFIEILAEWKTVGYNIKVGENDIRAKRIYK